MFSRLAGSVLVIAALLAVSLVLVDGRIGGVTAQTSQITVRHSSNVVAVFNSASLPSNYAQVISSAGGEVITAIPEIGVVSARAKISSDAFVQNLRLDRSIYQAGYDIVADLIMPTQVLPDNSAVAPQAVIPPPPSTIVGGAAADRYYKPGGGPPPQTTRRTNGLFIGSEGLEGESTGLRVERGMSQPEVHP